MSHYTSAQKKLAEFEVKYRIDHARDLISRALILITIITFVSVNIFFVILFGLLALAYYINDHDWLGFLVISGIQFLIFLCVIIGTRLFRSFILGRVLRLTSNLSESIYKFFFIHHNHKDKP